MANYESISELGFSILNILRRGLCPEIIKNENQIGIVSPAEKGDHSLGVYFYYVKEDRDNMSHDFIDINSNQRKFPPIFLKIGMMITANSKANLSDKALDEYKIMGRTIQIFHDNKILDSSDLVGGLNEQKHKIGIQFMSLDFDEQVRIWSMFNEPYRISAFYEISPIAIESKKIISTKRVESIDISVDRIK